MTQEETKQAEVDQLWEQHEMGSPKMEVVKLRGRIEAGKYYALNVIIGVEQSFLLRMPESHYSALQEAGIDIEQLLQNIAVGAGQ